LIVIFSAAALTDAGVPSGARAGGDRARLVLGMGWYAAALGATVFRDLAERHWLWSRVLRRPGGRGIALWWLGRRFPVVMAPYRDLRSFMLLERLFPRRRRFLVLLQLIYVSEQDWAIVETRGWLHLHLRRAFEKHIVRPAIASSLLRAQVLSEAERERQQAYFKLPEGTVRVIPWPLSTPLRQPPHMSAPTKIADGGEPPERVGVFSSGRAACDWATVFAVARGEEWPLTVVCGEDDLDEVRRLNADGRASVSSEVRMAVHDGLMSGAAVYLLALKEAQISSGQLRLATAIQCGTPVVASNVQGLVDYLHPDENALVFEPGDIAAAKAQVRDLLEDPRLGARLVSTARALSLQWTPEDYLRALDELLEDACAHTGAGSAGASGGGPRVDKRDM
jgi:glycosyltransferase involved in cell wall biosynthesis